MSDAGLRPLECRFAAGSGGIARSGVWRVWTRGSDLYCAVRYQASELKASIHGPRPPELPGWRRHWGFASSATSELSEAAIGDGGRHKVQWTGAAIGGGATLEITVVFCPPFDNEEPVDGKVRLLPVPEGGHVRVNVVLDPLNRLGPRPRDRDVRSELVGEGSFGTTHRAWVIASMHPTAFDPPELPTPRAAHFAEPLESLVDKDLRAMLVEQPQDGRLQLYDVRAGVRPRQPTTS